MSNPIGLYIHIPFCVKKCAYCDFFSAAGSEADYDNYTAQLAEKLKYYSDICGRKIATVYFGGGTPSVLGADRLCAVLDNVKRLFKVCADAEITCEVNPDSGVDLDFTKMREHGFNRVSVGMQSAVERELKALGRIHSVAQAKETVTRAQKSGINNVSLDLMLGIPYQTPKTLKESVRFCADSGVTHISAYILKIEEGTRFYSIKEKLPLPDENAQAQLYLSAVEELEKLGYEQYEISNFAKKGFESRHNINYWKCGEYIGIGPSAHSFFNGERFYYARSMRGFIENKTVSDGKGGDRAEFVMLSLRLKSGLDFAEYERRYSAPFPPSAHKKIGLYTRLGYMESDGLRAWLTPKGFLVSNSIISELIY